MLAMLERFIPRFTVYDTMFNALGPRGYTVALNIRNVTPEFYHSTFDEGWIERYNDKSYTLFDPVIHQLAVGDGAFRWSELFRLKVPFVTDNFLADARAHQLNYGLAVVRTTRVGKKRKQLLSIARDDREFHDSELSEAAASFEALLSQLNPEAHLTERMIQILTEFSTGLKYADCASRLNLSEATVKKDLDAARAILGASNTTEAVTIAHARKLIRPYGSPIW